MITIILTGLKADNIMQRTYNNIISPLVNYVHQNISSTTQ